jgi:hypothetical protein
MGTRTSLAGPIRGAANAAIFWSMYAQYPAIWSAKLVPPTLSPSTESVSVIVRVVYNTLEGIVNDFFVVTTTVSARNPR